ncbi:SDR family NAD(P)-dependent oxidoreductase [Seohaeicola zhoushanensis]|uniref:Oxidoreductase n=1 Tax=Seohaeicola zhoushanensis TaxID=1569283 RepID=A0A8J3GXI1_9RHOB|nr:SDR family NAD(P)-dependent oxidoreductase [Seohaeicola zhoushanensis]GHF48409.1 oxidoreductase [Seohaeicola zhoushanensis]
MSWLGLAGKCVVVTGGSGGIGRACLAAFHREGARVVALDRGVGVAQAVASALDPGGETALGLDCDISDREAVAEVAATVAARFGGADVVVNNAGILRPAPLERVSEADWGAMLRVNLTGSLWVAQAFAQQMASRGGGAVVQIASISASQPQPMSGAYSVSKAAVAMMVRQMAYEWGPRGIRANTVSPGLVLTPMSDAFYADPEVKRAREAMVPAGRIGTPEDMADAALFLASDRARYITGQEIVVDGGLSQSLMGLVPRPGYEPSREQRQG